MISSSADVMAFQMETRAPPPPAGICEAGPLGISSCCRPAMSSTGTAMRSLSCLGALALTIGDGAVAKSRDQGTKGPRDRVELSVVHIRRR